MQRRKAFATAGAAVAIAVTAAVALGANVGLFGLNRDSGPGTFKVVDAASVKRDPVTTKVIDVPVPVAAPGNGRSTSPGVRSASGSTQSAGAPQYHSDDESEYESEYEADEPEHEAEPELDEDD